MALGAAPGPGLDIDFGTSCLQSQEKYFPVSIWTKDHLQENQTGCNKLCVCVCCLCRCFRVLHYVWGGVSSGGGKFPTRAKYAPHSEVIFFMFNKFKVMFVFLTVKSGFTQRGVFSQVACSSVFCSRCWRCDGYPISPCSWRLTNRWWWEMPNPNQSLFHYQAHPSSFLAFTYISAKSVHRWTKLKTITAFLELTGIIGLGYSDLHLKKKSVDQGQKTWYQWIIFTSYLCFSLTFKKTLLSHTQTIRSNIHVHLDSEVQYSLSFSSVLVATNALATWSISPDVDCCYKIYQ